MHNALESYVALCDLLVHSANVEESKKTIEAMFDNTKKRGAQALFHMVLGVEFSDKKQEIFVNLDWKESDVDFDIRLKRVLGDVVNTVNLPEISKGSSEPVGFIDVLGDYTTALSLAGFELLMLNDDTDHSAFCVFRSENKLDVIEHLVTTKLY